MSLFEFCKEHIAHLGMLLWPIYKVTPQITSFEWHPEQEKALQQTKAAALPFEPYDPIGPMTPEIPVADVGTLLGAFGRLLQVNCSSDPYDFGAKSYHPLQITILKDFTSSTRERFTAFFDCTQDNCNISGNILNLLLSLF